MKIVFTPHGWADYCSPAGRPQDPQPGQPAQHRSRPRPGGGAGKPEWLSGDLAGFWSRRIDQEHRLVYTVHADELVIVQTRYHY